MFLENFSVLSCVKSVVFMLYVIFDYHKGEVFFSFSRGIFLVMIRRSFAPHPLIEETHFLRSIFVSVLQRMTNPLKLTLSRYPP